MKVRNLTEEDIPEVKRLYAVMDSDYLDFAPEDVDDAGFYVGGFIDNRLVGICTLGSIEGTDLEDEYGQDDCILSNVFVDPKYRNHGYGSALVRGAISYAETSFGPNANVHIDIIDGNLAEWYEQFGFVPSYVESGVVWSMILRR